MDQIRQDLLIEKDEKEEKSIAQQIRDMQNNRPSEIEKGLQQLELSHLKNLKGINDHAELYGTEVESMIANEKKEHEARKFALLKKGNECEAERKNNYDAVTTIELAKIEDLQKSLDETSLQVERETIEAAAKTKEVEVTISRENFNEVEKKREINDRISELNNEKLNEKREEIRLEEEQKLKEERNERQLHGNQMIAEIHEQMRDQRDMGNLNLAIMQHASDRKNRHKINEKIAGVKTTATDLGVFFDRIMGILQLDETNFERLERSRIRRTINALNDFKRNLGNINTELGNIEQDLARLELADVKMEDGIRQIKTQISQFGLIISNMQTLLDLKVPVKEETTKAFNELYTKLIEMINQMSPISEKREQLQQAVDNRKDQGTSPAVLQIEN